MTAEKIRSLYIYTDGASRRNPGNAAIGFTIHDDKGKIIAEKTESIGITTNNVAEYRALILALEKAQKYCQDEIFCFSDSQLVVKQLNGKNKVRKKHLNELFSEVKTREKMFEHVAYSHLPRENPKIKRIDKLVNKELDKLGRKK